MRDWVKAGWVQRLREMLRQMWVRVAVFSLGGIALAVLASWLAPVLPYVPEINLASGAVGSLLNIVASSMLAVTTFSMSIIVGAYGSATSNATPRATRLLASDPAAQNAVSVFIGSFLFSIVGIIGLNAGFYSGQARVVLFVAALGDILLIAWALLRWVDHLNDFGRMRDIIDRIEDAAKRAAALYRDHPTLGAVPTGTMGPLTGPQLRAAQSGYVRYVDIAGLQRLAEGADLYVEILRMPGKYVHRDEPLLRLSREVEPGLSGRLRDQFALGHARSFDQDVAYGLTVLSEVASKALSAAVNDPGTAVDVLRAGSRVLETLHAHPEDDDAGAVRHDRVCAPPLDVGRLYHALYVPILRDGAALFEVLETALDSLEALDRGGAGSPARRMLRRAQARVEALALSDPGAAAQP